MMFSGPGFRYLSRSGLNAALVAVSLTHAGLSAPAEPGAAMIAIDRVTPGPPPAGFTFALPGAGQQMAWEQIWGNGDQ